MRIDTRAGTHRWGPQALRVVRRPLSSSQHRFGRRRRRGEVLLLPGPGGWLWMGMGVAEPQTLSHEGVSRDTSLRAGCERTGGGPACLGSVSISIRRSSRPSPAAALGGGAAPRRCGEAMWRSVCSRMYCDVATLEPALSELTLQEHRAGSDR